MHEADLRDLRLTVKPDNENAPMPTPIVSNTTLYVLCTIKAANNIITVCPKNDKQLK